MGVFSANARSQFRDFFTGRRPVQAASSEGPWEECDAHPEQAVVLSMPADGFRPVSEFDGKTLEAMFTEADGGAGGGGGGLELEESAERKGGAGVRNWSADYGAAASAVAGLDVRTLATRSAMAIGVATGDFSADGLFDQDNADGWTELLQNAGAVREGHGFEAGVSSGDAADWMAGLDSGAEFPNLRGHGLLPDLSDAIGKNDALRQQVADFVASGQGGTDAGFLAAVEQEVTGILYGWAGLDRADGDAGEMRARFLDSYFGTTSGIGIGEVLPPEAISEMFDEVRDAAMLKLAGQGPVAGLFRDLAYDASADRLTGSATINRDTLSAFGSSAATLGPDGEAGAWRALADLTHGFESVLGSAGALPTLFAAVCGRGAELAGQVGEGMRTLGIDPGSLKVKLPEMAEESEGGEGDEADCGEDEETDSADAEDAGAPVDFADAARNGAYDRMEEAPVTAASTLDWDVYSASRDWAALPGGSDGAQGFGSLFGDYSAGPSPSRNSGDAGFERQGADLFQMPAITGFSIFDCFAQPCFSIA
jgi:hypothetical protein